MPDKLDDRCGTTIEHRFRAVAGKVGAMPIATAEFGQGIEIPAATGEAVKGEDVRRVFHAQRRSRYRVSVTKERGRECPNPLLGDVCTEDLLLLDRAVAGSLFHGFELLHGIHAGDDFTKDRVAHVQPRSRDGGDEKLAAVGTGAGVGHGEQTFLVEGDFTTALVFKGLSPDGFTSSTGASRVAALDHELFDDSMEDDAVVVAVLYVGAEVLAGLRCDVVEELQFDRALSGFEDDV